MAGKSYPSRLVLDLNEDGSVEAAYRTTTTEVMIGERTIKDTAVDGVSLSDLSVMLAAITLTVDKAAKAQGAALAMADANRAAAQSMADAKIADLKSRAV